jgi:DNA mismatch endonuclease, patch repair protein
LGSPPLTAAAAAQAAAALPSPLAGACSIVLDAYPETMVRSRHQTEGWYAEALALKSDPRSPPASSPATRRVMQSNRGRDTGPEVAVRALLHAAGFRFRKHCRPVPNIRCEADVVFSKAKVAVFLDGCFWHGCPEHGRRPRTNGTYWAAKIARNQARDRRNDEILALEGWTVIRAWEHDAPAVVARKVMESVAARSEGIAPRG